MTIKTQNTILRAIIGASLLLWLIVVLTHCSCPNYKNKTTTPTDNRLPTIEEIQKRIGCEKIDGKLGPSWRDSETQTKWDQALCNQYAVQYFQDWKGNK